MTMPHRLRAAFIILTTLAPLATALAQVQQQGAPNAPGTLPLTNLRAGVREATLAAIDARHNWNFANAVNEANKALALDSAFGLARQLRVAITGGTMQWTTTEAQRAAADAAKRGVPEATYVSGLRAAGANATRLLGAAREMFPNDRRVILDHILSFPARVRVDSLRALVGRSPDWMAPRLWLSYYLTLNIYNASPAELYEGRTVAEAAMRSEPNNAATHAVMGQALFRLGRLDDAAAHLAAATKIDPTIELAYALEAEINIRDGKPRGVDRSRAAYDSAIAVSVSEPRKTNYRRERAFMLFYDGRKTDGYAELASVAKEYEAAGVPGTAAIVYSQMAELAGGCGDSASMVDRFIQQAHAVAPNANVSVQAVQSYALAKMGAQARREFNDYLRMAPDTTTATYRGDVHRLSGLTLLAEGKPAEALAELEQADAAGNPFVDLGIVDAYTVLGKKTEAAAVLAAVAGRKLGPNSAVSLAVASYRSRKR